MGTTRNMGLSRLVFATLNSMKGFKAAWLNEEAFRMELCLAIIMIPAAFWLGTDVIEKLLLIVSTLIVLLTELLNSAVEAAIDRVGSEQHPLSGRAKDMGSAAVFISLTLVLTVWGLIILDRFAGLPG